MSAGYRTNGWGPITPPDTELRFDCNYCGEETTADLHGLETYGACQVCRPFAAMDRWTLVSYCRDLQLRVDELTPGCRRCRGTRLLGRVPCECARIGGDA